MTGDRLEPPVCNPMQDEGVLGCPQSLRCCRDIPSVPFLPGLEQGLSRALVPLLQGLIMPQGPTWLPLAVERRSLERTASPAGGLGCPQPVVLHPFTLCQVAPRGWCHLDHLTFPFTACLP